MSLTALVISGWVGGSECKCRSVMRTHPIFTLRDTNEPLDSAVTNSVDPPPMSATNTDPFTSSPESAPLYDSSASSSPLITSGSTPRIVLIPALKASRLVTSRDAEVAIKRIFFTSWLLSNSAYSRAAAKVRSSAASLNTPVVSTPSPNRTVRISLTRSVT